MPICSGCGSRSAVPRRAVTHAFTSQPVTDELLRQLYDLLKWDRLLGTRSPAATCLCDLRKRRRSGAGQCRSSNRAKTLAAPVTAIVAYDARFFERLHEWARAVRQGIATRDAALAEITALRNGSCRAPTDSRGPCAGACAGPMSGFNARPSTGSSLRIRPGARISWLSRIPDGSVVARPRAPAAFEDAVRIV